MIDIWGEDTLSKILYSYDDNEGKGYSRDEACARLKWLKANMKVPGQTYHLRDRDDLSIDIDAVAACATEEPFTLRIPKEYKQSVSSEDDDDEDEAYW